MSVRVTAVAGFGTTAYSAAEPGKAFEVSPGDERALARAGQE